MSWRGRQLKRPRIRAGGFYFSRGFAARSRALRARISRLRRSCAQLDKTAMLRRLVSTLSRWQFSRDLNHNPTCQSYEQAGTLTFTLQNAEWKQQLITTTNTTTNTTTTYKKRLPVGNRREKGLNVFIWYLEKEVKIRIILEEKLF